MTKRRVVVASVGTALLLAGCGKSGGDAPAAGGGTGGGVFSSASTWPLKNGCTALDKAAVSAAVGVPLTKVEPGDTTDSPNATLTLCTWWYDELRGGAVGLLMRTAKEDSYSAAAVAEARSGGGIAGPSTDVPGIGRAALWQPDLMSLQVFLDDRRYFAFNLSKPPAGIDPKAAAIALGKMIK